MVKRLSGDLLLFFKDKKLCTSTFTVHVSGDKRKTNKTVDKWVVLKHVHREKRGKWNSTFSVRTVYIFRHWGRRQVKKRVALVLMSVISVTVVLYVLWLWQRELTTSGSTKITYPLANRESLKILGEGSALLLHTWDWPMWTNSCSYVKSSSRCLAWLWSPTSICILIQPIVVWSSYVDSGLVRLFQPLGLLLQSWGEGSLGGCSVQWVSSSTN